MPVSFEECWYSMKQSDTWCPEIYRNIYIDRVNHDKVRIAPCCQAQGSTVDIKNLNHCSSLDIDIDLFYQGG